MRRHLLASSALLLAAAALTTGCGEDVTPASAGPNDAPLARLEAPLRARAGRPVLLDASGSEDPDGVVAAYIFDCGDGTPYFEALSPQAWHTWDDPGEYTITLSILDDRGSKDSTQVMIVVE